MGLGERVATPATGRTRELGVEVDVMGPGQVRRGIQVTAGRAGRRGEVPLDVDEDERTRVAGEVVEQLGGADEGTHSASQAPDGTLVPP